MRALIYSRVSDDRSHGRSVREQEAESRRVCDAQGWTVAKVVTDTVGASRHSKGRRSGWDETKAALEAGDVDVLVTWEASRAQRDLAAYTELREVCVRTGVLWHYGGRSHDMADSDDRFRTGLDALLAEDEAERTSKRVLRAVRANAVSGRPHGRRLYGYRRTYDPTTGALISQEPDPDEAPVVRRIFTDYLGGVPIRQIERRLAGEGITTAAGNRWDYTQLRRLLENPGYAGRRVHQGEVVGPANWPAIIDPDTFDRVQGRRAALYRPSPVGRAHLLTGVARCGVCGHRVTVNVSHGRRLYACRDQYCVARDQARLDEFVTAAVLSRLESVASDDLHAREDHGESAVLRGQVAALEAKLEAAADEYAAGQVSAVMLGRVEQRIAAQLAALRLQMRHLSVPFEFDLPTGDVVAWWDKTEHDRRREYIGALVDVVLIHKTKRGQRTFDPSRVEIVWR